MSDFRPELEAACALARGAGDILMSHYTRPVTVEWKGIHDPVTAADREASRYLVEELHKRFPDDGILSEEESDDLQRRLSAPRVWIVDPLDGTKEFIAHTGEFAVMIGLAVAGVTRLGVVYQPTSDKLYFAAHAQGSFLQESGTEERLYVSSLEEPHDAVIAMSRSRPSAVGAGVSASLGISRSIASGSLGLKLGLICEGKAHLYLQDGGIGLWDVCGPEAILREAGGRVTDLVGNPLRYDGEDVLFGQGVLASNGILHDRLVVAASHALDLRKPPAE